MTMARVTLGTSAAAILLLLACAMNVAAAVGKQKLYTKTFRSPAFTLGPGDVVDKNFLVDMPRGHIALRSFDAQVVDAQGTPIPLYETYLHHWVLERFYFPGGGKAKPGAGPGVGVGADAGSGPEPVLVPNDGVCQHGSLAQYYGLGSETRHTSTALPSPYGIVVGDAESIPVGSKEAWVLNVHAIDTRGTVDARGCTECVCALYNGTKAEDGTELSAEYEGGLKCCRDAAHCAVRLGFEGSRRELFMEYIVTWVDMSEDVVPVRIYILDVTDQKTALNAESSCKVEYTVHKCPEGADECIHTKESVAFLPEGGEVVYGVAHQHSGGIGATLHNQDGVEICSSVPKYGSGTEAGNEAGYIVGMSICYPEPGTVTIKSGEQLHLTSLYNNKKRHTGVMGLFYLAIADPRSPPPQSGFRMKLELGVLTIVAALIVIGVVIFRHQRSRSGGVAYQSIA